MNPEEYLFNLEDRLMVGYGRWVADFNESFRDLQVGDTLYDMVLEGNMRPKGFLVSRFFAWIAMPAHQAATFVVQSDANASQVGTMRKDIQDYMGERDLSWSWLVLLRQGPFTRKARLLVEKDKTRELGLALVDLEAREITHSRSYIGRRMPQFLKAFK
ncbi:MAG: hypothetical protein ACE5MI_14075 [Acidimicrobiia bacterium]